MVVVVYVGVLAFGVAALLFLVTEELLLEVNPHVCVIVELAAALRPD